MKKLRTHTCCELFANQRKLHTDSSELKVPYISNGAEQSHELILIDLISKYTIALMIN